MDPILASMLIGAGIGAAKGELIDKPAEKRDRKLQAITMRYSPWTHMAPREVKEHDTLGSTVQGGATGFAMGQNAHAAGLFADQGGGGSDGAPYAGPPMANQPGNSGWEKSPSGFPFAGPESKVPQGGTAYPPLAPQDGYDYPTWLAKQITGVK